MFLPQIPRCLVTPSSFYVFLAYKHWENVSCVDSVTECILCPPVTEGLGRKLAGLVGRSSSAVPVVSEWRPDRPRVRHPPTHPWIQLWRPDRQKHVSVFLSNTSWLIHSSSQKWCDLYSQLFRAHKKHKHLHVCSNIARLYTLSVHGLWHKNPIFCNTGDKQSSHCE